VSEANIFEGDREYWQSLKEDLEAEEHASPLMLSDDSDVSSDSYDSSTDLIPETPCRRKRRLRDQLETDITVDNCNGSAELHRATQVGNAESVSKLISAGADYNARDSSGQSALHRAAQFGYVDVYEHLSKFVQNDPTIVDHKVVRRYTLLPQEVP
jgi:ankyrin repeat protein